MIKLLLFFLKIPNEFKYDVLTSSSKEANFFFDVVKLPTINIKLHPLAPARALTLPPPGAGEDEANSFKNSSTLSSTNFIYYTP